MRRLINIKNGVVTLLSAAVIAGLAACEADPVETTRGNLPDDESLENTNVLIRSQYSSVERAVVRLTEGTGTTFDPIYCQLTRPAEKNGNGQSGIGRIESRGIQLYIRHGIPDDARLQCGNRR